jgi:mannose-1-phosphate guanylyltransferase/mannose-6-phosphate isomerase
MSEIQPLILCGGAGTRLWPLSRSMNPKQFIRAFNGQGTSLLSTTLQRLRPEAGFAAPILLSNNDHRYLVRDEVERDRPFNSVCARV